MKRQQSVTTGDFDSHCPYNTDDPASGEPIACSAATDHMLDIPGYKLVSVSCPRV